MQLNCFAFKSLKHAFTILVDDLGIDLGVCLRIDGLLSIGCVQSQAECDRRVQAIIDANIFNVAEVVIKAQTKASRLPTRFCPQCCYIEVEIKGGDLTLKDVWKRILERL